MVRYNLNIFLIVVYYSDEYKFHKYHRDYVFMPQGLVAFSVIFWTCNSDIFLCNISIVLGTERIACGSFF